MKTWSEITNKIDELMDKVTDLKHETGNGTRSAAIYNAAEIEAVCNQIDALLWVIGDRSGKEI